MLFQDTLNKVLPQKKKEAHYYQTISKHFQKQKDLQKYSARNPSFDIFITQLVQKTTSPKSF